jgi:hypothetical protein
MHGAVRDGDVAGAELLGPRQERILDDWTRDWSGGAWMKALVSQTLFADAVTPRLRVVKPVRGAVEGASLREACRG